eukprot:Nk52_evm1s385 gene=Nk52_evmTU1s385
MEEADLSSAGVGIIIPPPEYKAVIEKTASFVGRVGVAFEERIRANPAQSAKFNFLNAGDPYHKYYRLKVKEASGGGSAGSGEVEGANAEQRATKEPARDITTGEQVNQSGQNDDAVKAVEEEANHMGERKEAAEVSIEKAQKPPSVERPQDWEFLVNSPSMSALDMDVLKLTAEFVAKNGRQFLNQLVQKEQQNFQFDFLRPQHIWFPYFTKMVEQYTKIILHQKKMKEQVESTEAKTVLIRAQKRAEWIIQEDKIKKDAEAEEDANRIAFATIDWNDFTIVDTVIFDDDEELDLPPPVRPEELGLRILAQERYEQSQMEQATKDMDVSMDVDDDMDMDQSEDPAQSAKSGVTQETIRGKQNIKIRKGYDPKAKRTAEPTQPSDEYRTCPITGEQVLASAFDEHLRILLLDPKWKEQRDRVSSLLSRQAEVYASGDQIGTSLKRLAKKRTDIFGKEDGAAAKASEKKTQSDASGELTSHAALEALSRDAQPPPPPPIQSMPKSESNSFAPQSQMYDGRDAFSKNFNNSSFTAPPAPVPPTIPVAPPLMMARSNQGPPAIPPPPPPAVSSPAVTIDSAPNTKLTEEGEPPLKKLKEDDTLIPEADFISTITGPVSFVVSVPTYENTKGWSLNGQNVALVLDVEARVAAIKEAIQKELNMPSSKQKLQFKGMFLKDQNSLAYYNIGPDCSVTLSVKERGGKKR